jgi:hypothetical protein
MMIDVILARPGAFAGSLSGGRRVVAAIVVLTLLAVVIVAASFLAVSGHQVPLADGTAWTKA